MESGLTIPRADLRPAVIDHGTWVEYVWPDDAMRLGLAKGDDHAGAVERFRAERLARMTDNGR